MVSADFRRQLKAFGLTTVNILYRMPDHPGFSIGCPIIRASCKAMSGNFTTCILTFPNCGNFWTSGRANSTVPCTPSRLPMQV